MWDLSPSTRDRTHMSCIRRQSLNLWTAREVLQCFIDVIVVVALVIKLSPTLLWAHGRKSARFIYPWDFPDRNTGVSFHFLLPGESSWPRDWTQVSRTDRQFFSSEPPRSSHIILQSISQCALFFFSVILLSYNSTLFWPLDIRLPLWQVLAEPDHIT